MESLVACHELDSHESGVFVGYRDPETDEIFDTPPDHKYDELIAAAGYFEYESSGDVTLIQQLPRHVRHSCALHESPLALLGT